MITQLDIPLAISWITGIVLVSLFGYARFNEDTGAIRAAYKNRILSQIYIRDIVFQNQFNKSLFIYMFLIFLIFLTVSISGKGLGISGQAKISDTIWPFFSALLIVGLSPLPWFNKLELKLRTFLHNRAMMSSAAEMLSANLKTLEQNYQTLLPTQITDVFGSKQIEKKFHSKDLRFETNEWIKSGLLIIHLENATQDPNIAKQVGANFINKYKTLLEQLAEDRRGIIEQTRLDDSDSVEEFEENIARAKVAIGRLFDDIYSFCGCVLLNRPEHVGLTIALNSLEFQSTEDMQRKMRATRFVDYQFDVLITNYFYALIFSIILYGVFNIIDPSFAGVPTDWTIGWPKKDDIGENLYSLAIDLSWIGFVTWSLFAVRANKINNGTWYSQTPALDRAGVVNAKSKFKAGVTTLIIASFSLFVIGLILYLAVDNRCSEALGTAEKCQDLFTTYFMNFLGKEWLKLFSIIGGIILFCSSFEKSVKRSPFLYALISISMIFIFFVYLVQTELSGGQFRTGYLITYVVSIGLFWTLFVGLSWRNLRTHVSPHSAR